MQMKFRATERGRGGGRPVDHQPVKEVEPDGLSSTRNCRASPTVLHCPLLKSEGKKQSRGWRPLGSYILWMISLSGGWWRGLLFESPLWARWCPSPVVTSPCWLLNVDTGSLTLAVMACNGQRGISFLVTCFPCLCPYGTVSGSAAWVPQAQFYVSQRRPRPRGFVFHLL